MRDWIEEMKSCNAGYITLCNILYDYIEEQKIIRSSTLINTIQSFFAILEQKWSESRNKKTIDVFKQAIQEEFFLQSKNIVNYNSERYSRVIDERTLRTQNLDLSKIGWITDDKPISPRKLRTLENR
ncbi:MAG: hypothetical protein AAGE84_02570 [Cyanobacteria bacterium P01_G01_bin.39]